MRRSELTIFVPTGKVSWNVNPDRILVVHHASDITHRRMNQQLLLLAQLSPFLRIRIGHGTRVAQQRDALHVKVPDSWYVHLRAEPKVCAPDISINSDRTIAFSFRCADELAGREVLEAISEDVGMCVPEDKGSELHD